ncbi:MAG: cofactor-independent phosphoglycerate mutase [Lachnospiraceae bacterium]|nr:cofactor-independent phosphoglycerate mutase [Lachnospiraceae bacterium]
MKYVVVLGDGMADLPIEELQGKTPLEYAKTPMMDKLAAMSEIGLVHTIPEGMSPGSDTANLAALGYNPRQYYTGRSPLEALSIGVDMKATDIALRCNIVTVSDDELPYEQKTIIDHSSDEISTEDAAVLLNAVKEVFENETYKFYVGTSYRHLLIWDKGEVVSLVPPHDILTKVIADYLPTDEVLKDMMKRSYDILNNHPLNVKRAAEGKNKANSLWFWGAGTRPALSSFKEKTGLNGTMISAVDLLKGIAVGANMTVVEVEGANGGLHTNYEGKAQAAIDALKSDDCDYVYIHLEAPDEMGHQGSATNKVKAIEFLDERIIRPVYEALSASGMEFKMLVMPDHPTPICCRTHTPDAVPFMIYDSTNKKDANGEYTEKYAATTGIEIMEGYTLLDRFISK